MSVLPTSLHALIARRASDRTIYKELGLQHDATLESLKAYSDVVYYNYTARGISLQFTPVQGYKPPRTAKSTQDIDQNKLELSTIDIYSKQYAWSDSINITYASPGSGSADKEIQLTRETTGKELVAALGEPDRKGGGESRSVGVWLEWTGLGVMVEFSGVHGSQRWDVEHGAGNSLVGVLSIFQPGEQKGSSDD